MTADTSPPVDRHFQDALATIHKTLDKVYGCSDEERDHLQRDVAQLEDMLTRKFIGKI